jgi:hypothetical protein
MRVSRARSLWPFPCRASLIWIAAAPVLRPCASLPRPCRTDRENPLLLQSSARKPSCCVGRTGPFRTRLAVFYVQNGLLAHIRPQGFDTSSFASMNRASSSAQLTVSTSSFARINAGPLPMATQLSLLADAGHVIAGIADGALTPPSLVGRGRSSSWERYSGARVDNPAATILLPN